MLRFIVRLLGNGLAIYLAALFVPGFELAHGLNFAADWKVLLLAGFILTILNAVLKPILKLISAPLIILTLGLFGFVINIGLLWLLTSFLPELHITGLWAYVLGAVIVSLVNWAVTEFTKKTKKDN